MSSIRMSKGESVQVVGKSQPILDRWQLMGTIESGVIEWCGVGQLRSRRSLTRLREYYGYLGQQSHLQRRAWGWHKIARLGDQAEFVVRVIWEFDAERTAHSTPDYRLAIVVTAISGLPVCGAEGCVDDVKQNNRCRVSRRQDSPDTESSVHGWRTVDIRHM